MRYCGVEGRHAFSSMRAAHAWYVSSALPHDASHPFSSKSFGSTTSTSRGTNMPPYLHARRRRRRRRHSRDGRECRGWTCGGGAARRGASLGSAMLSAVKEMRGRGFPPTCGPFRRNSFSFSLVSAALNQGCVALKRTTDAHHGLVSGPRRHHALTTAATTPPSPPHHRPTHCRHFSPSPLQEHHARPLPRRRVALARFGAPDRAHARGEAAPQAPRRSRRHRRRPSRDNRAGWRPLMLRPVLPDHSHSFRRC